MKWSRLFLIGLLFIIMVVGAGVYLAVRAIPSLEDQIPGSPVSVQIVTPLNGGFYDSPQTIAIQVQATSPNNVTSLEVWADGMLVENQAVSQQFPMAVKAGFQFADASPGVHVLMARAVDAAGYTGQSSVVMFTVQPFSPMTEYLASEGDSLVSIADFLGVPEEDIAAVNPGIEPAGPLSDEQVVQLPVPQPKPPIIPEDKPTGGGGTPQDPGDPPSPVLYKLKDIASLWNGAKPLPAPPLLTGEIENCSQVKLTIYPQSSNEDGYFIYRWSYGETTFGFKNVNVLGLGGAEMQPLVYTEPMNGLASFYYVSAFNMQGESGSAPIALILDETCFSGLGGKQPIEVELLADFETGVPVQRSYCYYSTGQGEWQRFPNQDFAFFQPGEVFLDPIMFNVYPPNPIIQMECWGWDGPTLQFLGTGEAQLTPALDQLVGTNFSFDLPELTLMGYSPGGDTGSAMENPAIIGLADKKVPPPINLRQAENGTVCAQHLNLYPGQCQEILDKPLKEEYVLIWDWTQPTCWGNQKDCQWMEINGWMAYNLYMVDNPKPISPVFETGIVTPLPWGYQCFYVTAVADTAFGPIESEPSNVFCPDKSSPPKVMLLQPTNLISQGKTTKYQCLMPPLDPSDNVGQGQILVGVYDTPCWDAKFQGAVKFDLTQLYNLVGGYSLQKAVLRFDKAATGYQSQGTDWKVATNEKPLCGVDLGLVAGGGEWTNWDPGQALGGGYTWLTFVGSSSKPLSAIGPAKYEIHVEDYIEHLGQGWPNAGFGFATNFQRLIDLGYFKYGMLDRYCWNKLQNFELEIQYYSLGQ